MNKFLKLVAPGLAAAVMAFASVQAQADAFPAQQVYKFTGNCVDCALRAERESYEVTATLTLTGYSGTGALLFSNFVSFVYGGSNLIPDGFAINSGSGALGFSGGGFVDGQAADFYVTGIATPFDEQYFFSSSLLPSLSANDTNPWETGKGIGPLCFVGADSSCPPSEDYGNTHIWNAVPAQDPNNVPEPGSLLLMGAALAALAVARKRRAA